MHRTTRTSRWSQGTLGVSLALMLPGALPWVTPVAVGQPAGVVSPDPATLVADTTQPDSPRLQAAASLLSQADSSSVRGVIERWIAEPITPTSAGGIVLRAAGRSASLPPRLFPIFADRMARAVNGERVLFHGAVATFHTRDAARLILRDTEQGNDPAMVSSAFASLARLSGRTDLGMDRAAWWAWMQRVDAMTESQWRLALAEAQAARADQLAGQLAGVTTQLADLTRRLHLATPAEQRPEFLAALLMDDRASLRDVGFELITRELAAGGRVDGPVGAAALALLKQGESTVRAKAAVLVRQLAPAGAEEACVQALLAETDAAAANELLLNAARWPSSLVIAPVLGWLESRTGAREAAAEAVLALYRNGLLTEEHVARALDAIRSLTDADLTPSGLTFLVLVGDESDEARAQGLLDSPKAAVRLAAAESLLWEARYMDPILDAARRDPALFDVASRAALLHQPTSEGFARVLAITAPSAEAARNSLLRLARSLPATELLRVIETAIEPSLREALLGLLVSDVRVMSESADPERAKAIASGAILLAGLRLDQGDAAQSLATLDGVPGASILEPTRVGSLRCSALLAIGRLEDAAATVAPFEAWLRGLELARGRPYAADIAERITQRFPDLTPEQRDRLAAERAMISTASQPIQDPP